jgi:VanZ family protein
MRNHLPSSIWYGGPVFAYALLIFFLSSLSSYPESAPDFFGLDKLAHFTEYFIFGFLLFRWFSNVKFSPIKSRAMIMAIIAGMLYALTDEWHQSFVPCRNPSICDFIFDSIGVFSASILFPFLPLKERKLWAGNR